MDRDQEPTQSGGPEDGQPWILPAGADETSDDAADDAAATAGYAGPEYAATAPANHVPTHGRRLAAAAGVLVIGATAGTLVGHAVWQDAHSSTAASPFGNSGQSLPTTPQGTGEGGSGSGSNGNPFGFPEGGSGGFSGGFPGGGFPGQGGSGTGSSGVSNSNTSDGPTDAAAIAKDVDPGVVDITTTLSDGEAAGTGMVLTAGGEVLTNNHVIDGATSISVRDVGNGKTYKATVVGYDRTQDIAVLQLQGASGLSTVTTTTSEPSSGATVVAIGNAEGAGGTPSYAGGAITETNASITASDEYDGTSEKLTGLLATDAGVESGDSGGPLVDSSGEVVGMDTAASAGNSNGFGFSGGGSTDRGFAIPISTALDIANAIKNGESSATVHVGPTAELGVYGSVQGSGSGVLVEGTSSTGPAGQAGIAKGDTITSVDGTSVGSINALTTLMSQLTPGQKVEVDYTTSDGSSRTATVTLASGPPQ